MDRSSKRAVLAGVEVREDDIDPQPGLHVATHVIRGCAVVIILLAIWQVFDWWNHRTPDGAGIGLLAGETVRLIVIAGLLWAASALADIMVKTHHDTRASRILLARQTYMMKQMGVAEGALTPPADTGDRRGLEVAIPPRTSKEPRTDV